MLKPMLHPFKQFEVGRFANETPIIPVMMIQIPNGIKIAK